MRLKTATDKQDSRRQQVFYCRPSSLLPFNPTPPMTFITNLWAILTKAPQIIGIIAAIMNVIGSTQVRKVLEAIKEAMHDEGAAPNGTTDEPTRERLVTRIFRRLALRNLNLTEGQVAAMQNVYKNAANSATLA